jgi:WD40 repeat protein
MNSTQPQASSAGHLRNPGTNVRLAGCLLLVVALPIICIGATLMPLLPDVESIWHPQWSPHGDYVAFNCLFLSPESLRYYLAYPDDYIYLRDRYGDVCLSDQAGTHLERLSQGGTASQPSWSPDGRTLAWRQGTTLHLWEVASRRDQSFDIPELLDKYDSITWSGDGKYLFIAAARIDLRSHRLSLSSNVSADELAFGFTHSRDGTVLAYYQYRQGILASPSLIVERDSSQVTLLDARQLPFRNFDLLPPSPQGTYLSWIGRREWGEGDTLYLYQVAAGDLLSDALNPQWQVTDVSWSENERELALQTPAQVHILTLSQPEATSLPRVETHTTLIDIQYVHDWTISGGLSWSEDANHIAIGLGHDIWVIDLANERIRPLLNSQRVSMQQGADQARVAITVE